MARAFRDYWPRWPELQAACPFELVGPYGDWGWLDWLHPTTDIPHAQYTTVAALPKPPLLSQPVTATITFRAQAAAEPGLYYSTLAATVDGQAMPPLLQAAPVRVIQVVSRFSFPLILKSGVLQENAPFVVPSYAPGHEVAVVGIPSYTILSASSIGRTALDRSAARIIPLRGEGMAVTVDDTGTRAYVSRPGRQLDTLNLATGAVERTLALPTDLDLLAPDVGGQLVGIHIGDDQLFRLDAGTNRTTGTRMAGCGPVGVAIDARQGKIFVACAGDGSVVVLDRGLRPTARAAIAGGPVLAVAVDPAAGRLYVALPIVPGRHGIVVLDEDRLEPLARWGGGYEQPLDGLYALAVQPGSGRLVAGDRNALWWIDPGRLSLQLVRHVQTTVPRGSLVFTPDGKQLLQLDGVSLRVFEADPEGVH
jgi:DNA-binding beta-propeller fold protein YncE